ncbi:transposase, partial [Palleronia aestuarii]
VCDSQGRLLDLFVTAGQASDYIGARALLSGLPKVEWLLGDRGYDDDWFREALEDTGVGACIPGRKQRKAPVKYDKRRYKRRNRIEIMFERLEDWRRVATRYDRCPKVFLSAIALAGIVIYWPWNSMSPDSSCVLVGVCSFVRIDDLPEDLPGRDKMAEWGEWASSGNASIIAPGGRVLAGPAQMTQGLIEAEVDRSAVAERRRLFDVAGHYARPEVFTLHVDRTHKEPVQLH